MPDRAPIVVLYNLRDTLKKGIKISCPKILSCVLVVYLLYHIHQNCQAAIYCKNFPLPHNMWFYPAI